MLAKIYTNDPNTKRISKMRIDYNDSYFLSTTMYVIKLENVLWSFFSSLL